MNILNVFKKKQSNVNNNEDEFSQAVIIEAEFVSGLEFGSSEEQQLIFDLEDRLTEAIGSSGEVDGHEIGEGSFILYIYSRSADDTYDGIKGILENGGLAGCKVTLQYGLPQDAGTKEKIVTL